MTIPRFIRPGFFPRHFTPGHQWPYHGPTDWVFLNPVYETVVWSLTFTVKNVFKKNEKKTGLWDRGMVTGGPGRKPDWKKMTRSVRQWYGHWLVKDILHQKVRKRGKVLRSQVPVGKQILKLKWPIHIRTEGCTLLVPQFWQISVTLNKRQIDMFGAIF